MSATKLGVFCSSDVSVPLPCMNNDTECHQLSPPQGGKILTLDWALGGGTTYSTCRVAECIRRGCRIPLPTPGGDKYHTLGSGHWRGGDKVGERDKTNRPWRGIAFLWEQGLEHKKSLAARFGSDHNNCNRATENTVYPRSGQAGFLSEVSRCDYSCEFEHRAS